MNPFQMFLAALADYARSKGQDDIAEYLDLGGTVREATKDDREQLAAVTTEIRGFIAEGRGPNDAERASVRDRRKELSDQIRAIPDRNV